MRILFVNKLYAPDIAGGAELMTAVHVNAARARGHEVMVATTTAQPRRVDDVVEGVKVVRLPLQNIYWHHGQDRAPGWQRMLWHVKDSNNAGMADSLEPVLTEFRPELIVFHNLSGFSASVWNLARQRKVASLQVLHDYYHLCPRSHLLKGGHDCGSVCTSCKLFRVGRAAASSKVNGVVGVSRAVLGAHVDNGLFADVPIRRVVHNARRMAISATPAQRRQARVFGFIGTLAPWKGIGVLLEAFDRLCAKSPELSLRLLVGGEGEDAYVRGLREKHPSSRIEFLGRVKPEEFFSHLDASVVPSLWRDPLAGVVYESMLCGVPVIGAARGGIPEIIQPGVNGLLFDPDVPDALFDAMERFASDDELVNTLSRNGPVSAAPFADVDRMNADYDAVYHEVVESCRA